MTLAYPSTKQLPLCDRVENVVSIASLVEQLSLLGAIGVLQIGQLELHLQGKTISHVLHPEQVGEAAALAILQLEQGEYRFYAVHPKQTMQFEVSQNTLKAMKQLDETRAEVSVAVLPNLSIALEYLRSVGGLCGWKVRLVDNQHRSSVIFERERWQVIALEATWAELTTALNAV